MTVDSRHSRPAGRPRAFDPDQALRAALAVFWERGYEQASLDDLTRAMGINRSSFYACFGSKHDTLVRAARLYADDTFDAFRRAAEAAPEPRAAVEAVLWALAGADCGRRGCFIVNCIAELAPRDPAVDAVIGAHMSRVEALLADAVRRCRPSDPAPQSTATALLALALGTITLRKSGVALADSRRTLETGIAALL